MITRTQALHNISLHVWNFLVIFLTMQIANRHKLELILFVINHTSLVSQQYMQLITESDRSHTGRKWVECTALVRHKNGQFCDTPTEWLSTCI